MSGLCTLFLCMLWETGSFSNLLIVLAFYEHNLNSTTPNDVKRTQIPFSGVHVTKCIAVARTQLSFFQPLRLRFLRSAAMSLINTCLLFPCLSLRPSRAATMPLSAPVRLDRCELTGCPGFGLCATRQPDQIVGICWASWRRVLVAVFLPLPMNSSAQAVVLSQSSPPVSRRIVHRRPRRLSLPKALCSATLAIFTPIAGVLAATLVETMRGTLSA
jgi:hypothetical protein